MSDDICTTILGQPSSSLFFRDRNKREIESCPKMAVQISFLLRYTSTGYVFIEQHWKAETNQATT